MDQSTSTARDAVPGPQLHARLAAAAPPALADKMRAVRVAGERKPVTALFADFVGSTSLAESMDPEEWVEIVNRAFAAMSEDVYRYEGTIAQFSGDAIVAFFGAPVAHEDDPERAVRAALDIVATVRALAAELRASHKLDFEVRVGLNTGVVVVGNVGSDLRYEYTAIGDAMNVAARMQSAARPGSILATEATHRLVQAKFEAREVGPVQVKGKAEPVHAYEIVGLREAPGSGRGIEGLASPMVGRFEELERLLGLVDVVRAGRGRAALLEGEPGIGKSRLLAEFRSRVLGDGSPVTWAEGRCVSYGRSLPLHLVADLLRSLAGLPALAGEAEASEALRAHLAALLPDDHREPFAYLSHLLSLPLEAETSRHLATLDPQALHRHYLDALGRLVRASAARAPLVLVCEDAHWADPASVELLSALLPIVDELPALLLVTSRPDRDAPGWRLVTGAQERFGEALTEVRLAPLSPDDSRLLVANLLEIESLPQSLRHGILTRTEGNPFFLEEVVRMLIDRAAIERRGDRWVATDVVADVAIPETIHGLLLARIDRLPEEARRTARVASVIGRQFPVRCLEVVLAGDEAPVRPRLGLLEGHGLIRLAATSPDLEYRFRHALVQEAAYDSILKQQRRGLHLAVGEALEELYPERREELAPLLAHHFEQAGETGRAVEHLLVAGRHARERFAGREALGFYERAAAYLEGADDADGVRRRVEAQLGALEAGLPYVPTNEQLDLLRRALPDAERTGDVALTARAHALNAAVRDQRGEKYATSAELRASLARALDLSEELGGGPWRAVPLAIMGTAMVTGSQLREGVPVLTEAVALLEAQERLSDAGVMAGLLARTLGRLGDFAEADRWLARSHELADLSGDPNAKLDAWLFQGSVEGERGNVREAIEATRRGVELADQVGNTLCSLVGRFQLGDQHLRLNDPAAAIPELERSSELAEFCDAGVMVALARAWIEAARARMPEGQADLDVLAEQLETARTLGDAVGEGEIHRHRALVLASRDEPDSAAVFADFAEAERIFERLGTEPYLIRALQDHASALDLAGREAEARAVRARAEAVAAELRLG